MNSTVLSFLVVAAVAAFAADAMVFALPMGGGFWRNFGGMGNRGSFENNFRPPADNSGVKFLPAALLAPAPTPPARTSNTGALGALAGLASSYVPLTATMTPSGFNFPF